MNGDNKLLSQRDIQDSTSNVVPAANDSNLKYRLPKTKGGGPWPKWPNGKYATDLNVV